MRIGNTDIEPTKIICIGRNYLEHAKELNSPVPTEPVFFVKTLNSIITDGNPIIYPRILYENEEFNRVDHEVELAFIIQKSCKKISSANAYDFIQGFSIFLDITARKMQIFDRNRNLPWYRSKNFDTFSVIGPRIVPRVEIKDPHNLNIELKINSVVKQSSSTKYMIFKIPHLIEYLSSFITLEKGDIIATGTPSGVGPIQPGDNIEASIENIGMITHQVVLEREE
ncbi:MAG: fumarylacetoacetate hydrolase family protein [Promethearchaeota archaeon]|jgi:2-keto-4-pentenoate hydratase/2-oxohepta-3-ene-1,7-dioic acid hydratase in catechol pathway